MCLSKWFEKYSNWASLLLRVVLGLVFIMHGAQKLFGAFGGGGISGTAGFLGQLGFPAAGFFAVILAIVEFFGGLFVLVGLFTRYASLLIAIDMIIAILTVHLSKGFFAGNGGYEFVLTLLLVAVALLFSGAGKYLSLERAMFKKEF